MDKVEKLNVHKNLFCVEKRKFGIFFNLLEKYFVFHATDTKNKDGVRYIHKYRECFILLLIKKLNIIYYFLDLFSLFEPTLYVVNTYILHKNICFYQFSGISNKSFTFM